MDFVASREDEKEFGWRNRVGEFLREFGVTVFDPWFKPEILGVSEYGREDETTAKVRDQWNFEQGDAGAKARAACAEHFWPALHLDLRMVDVSDFVVAYVPTNVYSVGTPHEIIQCRQQRKPVLFVSPPITFPHLHELEEHLAGRGDKDGEELLKCVKAEVPIKENPVGAPSLWYLPLIGGEHFFDGFGFEEFRSVFGWDKDIPLDELEHRHPPQRPLLAFLRDLNTKLPQKWNRHSNTYGPNDDWLLWNLDGGTDDGAEVYDVNVARPSTETS
ncbi:hypothetical protein FHT44_006306 [Mycolicibacterium sp. BK634]|uniref:hypothetical protein n=1 Tax=Mycolicibacterium sp. BK634 TaxID=2587099 RepID=UPI001616EE74|nr:hypothetical protein [Mycolicibacterium sp. BK634]MBB3753784.1 hypothetical protein [Mycolicibacterium sp. BK634]